MKSRIHTTLLLCLLLSWSCSNDDDAGSNPTPPTTAELLVSHGVWTFADFNLLEIRDMGPSTVASEDIEAELIDEFLGTTVQFNSNLTGTLTNPQAQSPFTWELISENELQLVPSQGDPINFDTINVTATQLMLNTEATFYDNAVDYDVVVYGTFVFN